MDAWGSTDAWASSAPSQPAASVVTAPQTHPKASAGWGAPQVAQDDDFGGWSSAAPTTTNRTQNAPASKPGGGFGGGGDDLFSNVWQ